MSKRTTTITSTDLAARTGDILNRVHYGNERIVVTKRGKPIATIHAVPANDADDVDDEK